MKKKKMHIKVAPIPMNTGSDAVPTDHLSRSFETSASPAHAHTHTHSLLLSLAG